MKLLLSLLFVLVLSSFAYSQCSSGSYGVGFGYSGYSYPSYSYTPQYYYPVQTVKPPAPTLYYSTMTAKSATPVGTPDQLKVQLDKSNKKIDELTKRLEVLEANERKMRKFVIRMYYDQEDMGELIGKLKIQEDIDPVGSESVGSPASSPVGLQEIPKYIARPIN